MPARSRALQPCFPVTLQPWIQCVRAGTTHFAVETLAYQPLYIISRIQHYQLTEMIRDDIRSQIQIQIEQIESSIRDFDVRKISDEEAEQISLEAYALIEKLRAVYMDVGS
jgi:hypothetical protein